MVVEKMIKPFVCFAEGLEKSLDPILSEPLMEFFAKAVVNSKSILASSVADDGTLYALGIDGETLFSQPCPLTKDPEAMREICNLMVSMCIGTQRAIEKLK